MSQDIKPGWYWARDVRGAPQVGKWEVVQVFDRRGSLEVWSTNSDYAYQVDEFEFGPRIEEPQP